MTMAHRPATSLLDVADAPAIEGLRFRRPDGSDADIAAIASLIAAANGHDGIPYAPSAQNIREEFDAATNLDPATDIVLAEVDGGLVANAGSDRVVRGGTVTFQTWGHVDPAWRRRGLGRALLQENLRRIDERGAAEPAGTAFEARAFMAESEAGHEALLRATGFERIRWFFEMRRVGLTDLPDAPLPAGLEIRPVTPDQHRTIFDADVDAFRDHWDERQHTDAEFEELFAKSDLDTSLWVVAWDGDEVAGVVQSWVWHGENAQLGVQRGWLEHISVRRPWRRRGLARALTADAMRRLAVAGMTEAMLGVDAENPTGALGLYEGLGFSVDQRSSAWRLPPGRDPRGASQDR